MQSTVPSLWVRDQPSIESCRTLSLFMDASIAQLCRQPKGVCQECLLALGPVCTGNLAMPTFRPSYQRARKTQCSFFFLTLLILKCHLLYDVFWIQLRRPWVVCICFLCGPDEDAVLSDTAAAGMRELECLKEVRVLSPSRTFAHSRRTV